MFFPRFKKSTNNNGFSIIEALVGITLAALLLVAFTSLITQTIKINQANMSKLKATMYLQELIEIAKDLEQSATSTIFYNTGDPSPCTNCHPIVKGIAWEFDNDPLNNPETIDGFTRSMTISPVLRDWWSGNIVQTGGIDDPWTKMATATISWYDGFKYNTSTLETYLYYYGQ